MKLMIIATAIAVSLVCAALLTRQSARMRSGQTTQRKPDAEAPKQLTGDERAVEWPNLLRALREEFEKPAPDNNKLAMLFANLSVAVHDQPTIDETLKVFEKAESETKLSAEARPYYAQLLFERWNSYPRPFTDEASLKESGERLLSPALKLFLQAYSDEAAKNTIDDRKLIDICLGVVKTYQALGRGDEADRWLQSLLTVSTLPESVRAELAVTLSWRFWEKSYGLKIEYSNKHQPIPAADVNRIRDWLNEAYSYCNTSHSLAPTRANPWGIENVVALELAEIETDAQQKKALQKRALEVEERFTALRNGQPRASDYDERYSPANTMPYESGLPSLNFSTVEFIVSPPPPNRLPGKKPE